MRRALARIVTGQEAFDGGDVLGFVDREAAVLRVANEAGFVDQDAVRDNPEIEKRRCQPLLVNDSGVLRRGGLNERLGQFRAAVFECYRDEFEFVGFVAGVEILPAWQLLAASSPRSPEEKQQLPAAQRPEIKLPAIELRQPDLREILSDPSACIRRCCHHNPPNLLSSLLASLIPDPYSLIHRIAPCPSTAWTPLTPLTTWVTRRSTATLARDSAVPRSTSCRRMMRSSMALVAWYIA